MSPRTVFSPYVRLFAVPGSRRFSFAGWVGPAAHPDARPRRRPAGRRRDRQLRHRRRGVRHAGPGRSVVSPAVGPRDGPPRAGRVLRVGDGRRSCSPVSGSPPPSSSGPRGGPGSLLGGAHRRERAEHRLPDPGAVGRGAGRRAPADRVRASSRSSTRWCSSSGRRWSPCSPR